MSTLRATVDVPTDAVDPATFLKAIELLAEERGWDKQGAVVSVEILLPPVVCRQCGCTDDDCAGCIERTGHACWWTEPYVPGIPNLCTACSA